MLPSARCSRPRSGPLLGIALGRRLLPRALGRGAAPVIGWAAHSAVMLPIYAWIGPWIGFSPIAVIGTGALCVLASGLALSGRAPQGEAEDAADIPAWAFAAAAVLALAPAVAILPKFSGDAVQLADPIFDHSKIAIVDAMARLGLPPVNPVFGEFGAPGHLAYYYLWHFSAAELALALGASGWEADIGLTWFTAFASLSLMMGVAVWLGKRAAAAIWVVVLAAAASLWVTLDWIAGAHDLTPWLWPPIGMAGWLFQATWVPQHLMAASCAVTAMLVIVQYAQRQSLTLLLTLVLVVVAGFESSSFVGGVTFAIAALDRRADPSARHRAGAAPALRAGLGGRRSAGGLPRRAVRSRSTGGAARARRRQPDRYRTLHACSARRCRTRSAACSISRPIGSSCCRSNCRPPISPAPSRSPRRCAAPCRGRKSSLSRSLACLAGTGLIVSWLLVSTLGENNDLGLRAIIPAEMVLIVAAAAGFFQARWRAAIVATALGGLVLSLPDTAAMIRSNVAGEPRPGGKILAQTPELWDAVRRYAAPGARVANNPLFLRDVTPWPVNISWALLANRSSCFAGRELALALAPLPPPRREAINAQFIRVFAGEGTAADVSDMATQYGCEVVVVVPQDKAWNNDPFAASADYRLAENRDGRWRIYVRVK